MSNNNRNQPPTPNAPKVPDAKAPDTVEDPNAEGTVVTYVGKGEDSPRVINFMGKHKFVRGEPQRIHDPVLLAKIIGNPTFVEGTVKQEELHDLDEEAAAEAAKQRAEDKRVNDAFTKKHKTE